MVDYHESSQLNNWLFANEGELNLCRSRANYEARVYLRQLSEEKKKISSSFGDNNGGTSSTEKDGVGGSSAVSEMQPGLLSSALSGPLPILHFACIPEERAKTLKRSMDYETGGPWEDAYGKAFLKASEEATLVSFYASKLSSVIGPNATVPRLRREGKVLATASLLLRRFFLSNSVMLFDPKSIMVAAAFLASKVEDVTADVRNIEEATVLMNAPVPLAQIVQSEVYLLAGVNFYLLCFHPYKAVLALTEDLRTFFKTSAGKRLLLKKEGRPDTALAESPSSKGSGGAVITGQDLKPVYDTARGLLDDVVVSDLPMYSTPGQVGLAALIAAQEIVLEQYKASAQQNRQQEGGSTTTPPPPPTIDFMGYVKERFPRESEDAERAISEGWLPYQLSELTRRIRELKDGGGLHGCGHYLTDLGALKKIHKKLKRVRLWGANNNDNGTDTGSSNNSDKNTTNNDKNNITDDNGGGGGGKKKKNKLVDGSNMSSKRIKTE